MTVTYSEYMQEHTNFARKHNQKSECKIYTSPMENNRYHKEYCWQHGANFYEVTELVTEKVKVMVHGIEVVVDVDFWRTEYWHSDNSKSKFFYEKA
jgi:hypothetical protein